MALQLFKIADVTVASPVADVTFSNIPSGYTDLKLVISARRSASFSDGQIRFNGDSSTVYSSRQLRGDGSATVSTSTSGAAQAIIGQPFARGNSTSNTFSNAEIYIPNYTSSNNKSLSIDTVTENNATAADACLTASLWANTAAITSFTIYPDIGYGTIEANSTFTLYGVL